MRPSGFRVLISACLLALLLAPEALVLHRCPCGRIFNCCCRKMSRAGDACPLHPGMSAPAAHCAGASTDAPASLQSRQEPVDRFGVSLPAVAGLHLPFAGWLAGERRLAAANLVPAPLLPPPRLG